MPKSKPVAHTMTSTSTSPSAVSIPVSVISQDGCGLEVDQRDVGLVERLVVPGDERGALLAEAVIRGDELGDGVRIVDEAADLLGDELAPRRVGLLVEEQVGVVAGELGEPGALPHLLEERVALLLGVVERGAVVRLVQEAGDRRVEDLPHGLEVGPQLGLLLVADRLVVQRRAPVGGALVHGQGGDLVGDGRDHLDAARRRCRSRRPACRRSRPVPSAIARCGATGPRSRSRPGTSG